MAALPHCSGADAALRKDEMNTICKCEGAKKNRPASSPIRAYNNVPRASAKWFYR
nr:MAG TPA: hypothetical protein [Caudoviricetes sp.]